jgi:IS30 family transposase
MTSHEIIFVGSPQSLTRLIDFKKISQTVVQDVIVWLRKNLNYKTPATLLAVHLVAIAA